MCIEKQKKLHGQLNWIYSESRAFSSLKLQQKQKAVICHVGCSKLNRLV